MEASTTSTDRYPEMTAHFGQTCCADMNASREASQRTDDMSNRTPKVTSTPHCTDMQHSWESVNVRKGKCRLKRRKIGEGNCSYAWSDVVGSAEVPHHYFSAISRPKHVLDMSTFVRMEVSQWLVRWDVVRRDGFADLGVDKTPRRRESIIMLWRWSALCGVRIKTAVDQTQGLEAEATSVKAA